MYRLIHFREGDLLKILEEDEALPLAVDLDGEYIRFLVSYPKY